MKKLFLFIALITLTYTSIFSQSVDEQSIIQVIEAETRAFCSESLEAVTEKYWILDKFSVRCVSFLDGSTYQHRFEDLIASNLVPPGNHADFIQSNIRIHVIGTMASASYDQMATILDGKDVEFQHTHVITVLEKVNDTWKIHMMAVHHYKP
jgi:allophanate hydrolase subunit 2